MKHIALSTAFLIYSILSFAQEEQPLGVLESDTTWLKEIIKFPINFAPEMNYEKGYEDLRFAKKWRDQTHEDFWGYTFAWYIEQKEIQTVENLESNIKSYYDGLMGAVNKRKDFEVPQTTVLFIKNNSEEHIDFTGKLYVYDSFTSEDMITLNIRVKVFDCEDETSTIVLFQLSPKNFSHEIWQRFEDVKIKDSLLCEK
ncbi:hypothetical protein [Psychroserpens sp. Hel_I_66]|uniref:hypothetical protein n=1 Tax=Psychroserpens sp. Hel_I_66 TaxID=1250004 RepID=UPI0006460642|nr:hypothetical protein [Psychroserpens sp. Hel_I_66]